MQCGWMLVAALYQSVRSPKIIGVRRPKTFEVCLEKTKMTHRYSAVLGHTVQY